MTKDNLDNLFVSNDQLNKELLFEILESKIKITEEGEVMIFGEFDSFQKILLYILGRKVLLIKNKLETEEAGPAEISKNTGISLGTVKVYVKKLEREQVLMNKNGKYKIPNFILPKVNERFKNG